MAVRRFSTSSIRTGTKSSKFWDQSTSLGSYDSISSTSLTSTSNTITFTSIPSSYNFLVIRGFYTKSNMTGGNNTRIQFNSDTGANYNTHYLEGDSSATVITNQGSQAPNAISIGWDGSSNTTWWTGFVSTITDYADANKYTIVHTLGGNDRNGAGDILVQSGQWSVTTTVNRIDITTQSGYFNIGSQFSLYGVN